MSVHWATALCRATDGSQLDVPGRTSAPQTHSQFEETTFLDNWMNNLHSTTCRSCSSTCATKSRHVKARQTGEPGAPVYVHSADVLIVRL